MFRKRWYCCGYKRDIWKSLWRYSRKQIWRAFWNIILLHMSDVSNFQILLSTTAFHLLSSLGSSLNSYFIFTYVCKCKLYLRYTCNKFDNFTGGVLLMWNTSVSDHCCQSCDGVVSKADSVVSTIHHEDECQTTETSVCRILPGEYVKLSKRGWPWPSFQDREGAVIQNEFNFKNCCKDGQGNLGKLTRPNIPLYFHPFAKGYPE